ncbi:MAG: c-type cytochrome [Chromatiaceae bacterium]|nr:c-type cytochrome [Gammaproteobacteria bacterium]MCP5312178.1 c-type cytochrome [Chromatiaceae bacterium]
MFKKPLVGIALTSALVLAAGSAVALDGAELYQKKTCFSCHGKDAKTPILPMYPKLAGQNAAYAAQQMKDIKSGARANGQAAAMKGVMHLVSDEEIDAIAQWLSTL